MKKTKEFWVAIEKNGNPIQIYNKIEDARLTASRCTEAYNEKVSVIKVRKVFPRRRKK